MSRLSPGTLLLGIFAVLFGLVGAYAARQYLQQKPPEEAPVETAARQTVPLASADLSPGRTITMGDVMLVRMTRDEIRKRGIPGDFMTNPSQVIGRTLRTPLKRGRSFVTTAFYPEGTGPSVAARLKPGYRAVTIPLEPDSAAAGLVSPGSVVDVIFRAFPNEKQQMPETTVTLLDRVEVLAIGQETFQGARTGPGNNRRNRVATTVTLAVTPEQAAALKVVQGRGTIFLVLRGPEDESVPSPIAPKTLAGLLGLSKPKAPFTTEIYRRGQLTRAVFYEGRQTMSLQPVVLGRFPVGTSTHTAHAAVPQALPVLATTTLPTLATKTLPTLAAKEAPAESDPCDCEDN